MSVKLRVEDITAEAKELSFVEPEQELNRILARGSVNEYRLETPIAVDVAYYRAGTELFFQGVLKAMTRACCARCAEEFELPRERAFHYVLAPRVIGYDRQADLRAEDLEFSLYEGEQVDLTPLIREQMLLALTERPVCREECQGLCPHCGANLNDGDCGCRDEAFDPRLSVLRSIKGRN
ncbi:MAG: YceD family protein [Candidatus Binataceae bacterium]